LCPSGGCNTCCQSQCGAGDQFAVHEGLQKHRHLKRRKGSAIAMQNVQPLSSKFVGPSMVQGCAPPGWSTCMNHVCAQPAGVACGLITGCSYRSGSAALCGPRGTNRFLILADISAGMLSRRENYAKNIPFGH